MAFFFRNGLDVLNVGCRLRQDVVKIVAYADKRETFIEEFAHACRAEQEETENDVVFSGGRLQLLSGVAQFRRCVHLRELILFVEPHRHAEIILAQEKNINAGNGRDRIDVLDAIRGLDLQPVIATVRQLLRNRRAVRIEEQAQLRAPFSELLLKLRPTNSFTHSVFSSFIAGRPLSILLAPGPPSGSFRYAFGLFTTGRSPHAQILASGPPSGSFRYAFGFFTTGRSPHAESTRQSRSFTR